MTKFYDKIANEYHNFMDASDNFFNKYVEEPHTLNKLSEINIKDKRVLDLGCGSGRYTKVLLKNGGVVSGIDPSSKLLAIARKEIPGGDFKEGSAENIPYEKNEFDLVFAGMAIQYFESLEKAFEIARVLKPKGVFIYTGHVPYIAIANPIKIDGKKYYEFDNYFKERLRRRKWSSLKVMMPYYHFKFETIIKTLMKNGFEVKDYQDLKPLKEGKKVDLGDYNEVVNKGKFYLMQLQKK